MSPSVCLKFPFLIVYNQIMLFWQEYYVTLSLVHHIRRRKMSVYAIIGSVYFDHLRYSRGSSL